MVEEVKYIRFDEVPEAPRIAVPADFTQDQINEYLKSDYVEQTLAEKGFAFKYGLQPVNQLELDNLDDWHLTSGLKKGWLSTKSIGQGILAYANDVLGNEDARQEALRAAEQYQLDKAALAYQVDDEGKLLPRIEKIEDIVNSEEHLTAFTKYVREKFGEAAATSFPTLLLGAIGAGVGAIGGTLIAPGAGTVGGGVAGAKFGATAGTLLSGFMFGLGETYLAQAEETEDPNLAIAVALGIPYAAAERLGIGGVVPSLVKAFGGREQAAKAVKDGLLKDLIKGDVIKKGKAVGKFVTEVGRVGVEEGLAESIQETLTTFGGGLEAGKGFEEMFNNKEFAKQLGEAAAAGFFGGMPFGTINPSIKALKVLNRMGGVNNKLDGSTLGGTLNDDPDQEPIQSAPFDIGSTVTIDNEYNEDVDTERQAELEKLFGKPKFKVLGTADIEMIKGQGPETVFVLQSDAIKPTAVFLRPTELGKVNVIEDPAEGGDVPEKKENFAYDGQQTTNKLDDATRKQHTDLKRRMVQTGHLNSAQETEVTTFLEGDDKIVRNVANRIIADRETQREEIKTFQATPQEDRESDLLDFVPKLDRSFAKYDAVPDNELEEAIRGDLPFWRTREFAERAEGMSQEVKITPEQDQQLKDLGYFGERGQSYVDERIRSNVNPVNKTTSSGKALLDSILRNGTRFSSIPDILGGPVKIQQKIGEKISKNEPLTAQEKASLSGDRLIPATKYDPSTYTEEMSFEDLYNKPVEVRMRIVLELAGKLDKDGWKRKQINDPQLRELEQALKNKIKVAEFQYGRLSESYKQAKKDLADFRNTGEHVLINGLAPKGVFSLVPILSPTALKTYENIITNLQRNLQSEDPVVRKTAAEQLPVYQNMLGQVLEARIQMNELLKSMSIEPILNWNEFTERSMKSKINKYRKKLNQTDTEFKKKDIYSQYTMLNSDPTDINYPPVQTNVQASLLQIISYFRTELDKLGLSNIDVAMLTRTASSLMIGRPSVRATYLPDKGLDMAKYMGGRGVVKEGFAVDELNPNLHLGVVHIAFNLDEYNNASPEEKKTIIADAFSSLNHEAIHALFDMGLFTDQELSVLKQASEEFFIKDYNVEARYPRSNFPDYTDQQFKEMQIEEGIASAMQAFLADRKDPPASLTKKYGTDKNILQRLFNRIKAFLSLLGLSFKQNGFNSAYDIFDAVSTGIVGQRVKNNKEIQQMKAADQVLSTLAINPQGAIVASNAFADTDVNVEFQRNLLGFTATDNRFKTVNEALDFIEGINKDSPTSDKQEARELRRVLNKITNLPFQNVKFESKIDGASVPNKIKFGVGFEGGKGGITETEPYYSMYTYMTPDEFLGLVTPTDFTQDYGKMTTDYLKSIVEKDAAPLGIPYLIIEIDKSGGRGRIYAHEGRHRSQTSRLINGGQSTLPVAIKFFVKSDPGDENLFGRGGERSNREAYRATKYGRYDPVNQERLKTFLREGILEGESSNSTIQTTQASAILNDIYEEFEQNDDNSFTFSRPYNNDFANNPAIRYEMGEVQDPANRMNRQQKRAATKKLKEAIKDGEQAYVPGSSQTPRKMSYFSRILGHARAWAKMDTPFRLMYANVMNKIFKSRSLQMSLTAKLKERYLEVKKDPVVNERINKAHIIMEMTGQFPEFNENGELVFVAPADGGAADLDVVAGEVVILTGDVAMAMKDHQLVMASIIKEDLKATIARDHIEDLTEALNVIRTFFPNLPELRDQFNFEGMTEEQISYALENLNVQQIKFIVDNLSNVMIGRGMVTGEFAEIINRLLGNQDAGLNKLLAEANIAEGYMSKPYVPLQRFGTAFISVKDDEGRTIWYETFEGTVGTETFGNRSALRKAAAKRSELVSKYPNATVSQPEVMTIQEVRRLIKEAGPTVSIEYLSQFMSDTNARRFQEAMKEMRQILAAKGLDKDISPIGAYRTPRDRSVGLEGVPGYSADFTRGTLQYIMTASEAIARNRYQPLIRKHYGDTIEYAQNVKDVNLQEATQSFFDYTEDPVQEFANLRRMGFWWYLGGNISSAMLQTMSLFQFTGPLLSQMAGTKATTIELGKAIADARTMVSIFNRQYEDAFIDFTKVFDDEPGMADAIYTAVADGTIKQGQAMQEAGIVPGPGGTQVGTQQAARKNFRKFENIFVGGTFNTFEAISRITAFMTAYRLASKNPKVLEEAEVLYGNDMDYQNQKDRYGNTPEAFARFMVEETFGVYGKENRPRLARGFGALPALFMTYISQMFGLLYRLLNPVGMAANKSRLQNKVGRRAFARIMLMMLITGGLFGLPGGEDAEDIYNLVRKELTGVDADVRSEFRNMLYSAGWSPTMIEALESGLLSAYLNVDVQRRIGFGVAPWSTQIRAAASIAGVDTGARAEEFLGAPGSVFIDGLNNLATLGIREGRWGDAIIQSLPLGIKNPLKSLDYMIGEGYLTTSYGSVVTDDIGAVDVLSQFLGFTPTEIAKNREALFLMRKMDRASNVFKQRINARIENAYIKIIMGGKNRNGNLINEGQAEIQKIYKDVMKHNQNNPNQMFIPDLNRKFDDALRAADPNYAIMKGKQETVAQKLRLREALGLN
jgi:hypothetical protein